MTTTTATPTDIKASDIRAWARRNGYHVADRGRIAADVRRAYIHAHR